MEFKTRKGYNFIELRVECNNATITEDLTTIIAGKWVVPHDTIDQLISVANDCSRFNGDSDVDFVKQIYDSHLNDSEKEHFLDSVYPARSKVSEMLEMLNKVKNTLKDVYECDVTEIEQLIKEATTIY